MGTVKKWQSFHSITKQMSTLDLWQTVNIYFKNSKQKNVGKELGCRVV